MTRYPAALLLIFLSIFLVGFFSPKEPSLWKSRDAKLHKTFTNELRKEFKRELWLGINQKRIAVVLVDITDLEHPRVAEFNGDVMMYAASLPKIAILLGALVEVERGTLELDDELRDSLTRMIRESSNADATAILNQVGFENLANILRSRRFRLYDPSHNGGLWVGRDYGGGTLWRRDPLHAISHGATAMQTARFYYLAAAGRLLDPRLNDALLEILSQPAIEHKFVKGLDDVNPDATIYRKSGTWMQYHSDSGIVVADNYRYVIVAITRTPQGETLLERLIGVAEQTMRRLHGE